LLDDNRVNGIFARGADVTVERTVVRATRAQDADRRFGRGIESDAQLFCAPDGTGCTQGIRPKLAVTTSLVAESHNIGVYAYGSDVALSGTVVRDTQPRVLDQQY